MTEIVFIVEEAPEGGYIACTLEHAIITDESLKRNDYGCDEIPI
jgi:hypothetical protein